MPNLKIINYPEKAVTELPLVCQNLKQVAFLNV